LIWTDCLWYATVVLHRSLTHKNMSQKYVIMNRLLSKLSTVLEHKIVLSHCLIVWRIEEELWWEVLSAIKWCHTCFSLHIHDWSHTYLPQAFPKSRINFCFSTVNCACATYINTRIKNVICRERMTQTIIFRNQTFLNSLAANRSVSIFTS